MLWHERFQQYSCTNFGYVYSLEFGASIMLCMFCNPSLIRVSIVVLFLLALSTKTWVYPPIALGTSFPSSKTPISYVTELFPSLLTRSPRSMTAGNDTGAKKWQYEETTRPMMTEDEGFKPQWWMRYVLTMESKKWKYMELLIWAYWSLSLLIMRRERWASSTRPSSSACHLPPSAVWKEERVVTPFTSFEIFHFRHESVSSILTVCLRCVRSVLMMELKGNLRVAGELTKRHWQSWSLRVYKSDASCSVARSPVLLHPPPIPPEHFKPFLSWRHPLRLRGRATCLSPQTLLRFIPSLKSRVTLTRSLNSAHTCLWPTLESPVPQNITA